MCLFHRYSLYKNKILHLFTAFGLPYYPDDPVTEELRLIVGASPMHDDLI